MPRDEHASAPPEPATYTRAGRAAVDAMVARTAPAVLELLADGVPRFRAAIVEALAGRHHRSDVIHTLIRLAAAGHVARIGGEYTAGAGPEPGTA